MFPKILLAHLAARASVQITLPVRGSGSVSRPCTVEKIEPPLVEVRLAPEGGALSDLQLQGIGVISCEHGGSIYTIHARLQAIEGDNLLRLRATEVIPLNQKRRFFRIDAELHMRYWHIEGEGEPSAKAVLKKVNLSGCGIRFTAAEPLAIGQNLKLELVFPAPMGGCAQALGTVVRLENRDDHYQEAALDLVEIDAEDQEKIIRFCLAEQLRQIRLKVRVRAR